MHASYASVSVCMPVPVSVSLAHLSLRPPPPLPLIPLVRRAGARSKDGKRDGQASKACHDCQIQHIYAPCEWAGCGVSFCAG